MFLLTSSSLAHEWHKPGDERIPHTGIHENETSTRTLLVVTTKTDSSSRTDERGKPDIARHFEHFKNVKTRWDKDTLFVESNGLPEHNMMVGIIDWQQQVPLPQPFTGSNSWKIPLQPKLADKPLNAKLNAVSRCDRTRRKWCSHFQPVEQPRSRRLPRRGAG